MGASRTFIVSPITAQRLEQAKAWLKSMERDQEVLILGPHPVAADQLVHSLVAEDGSRFGLKRFTLNRLAAYLAAAELARQGLAPATPLSLSAIVTRAVHRVMQEGAGTRYATVASRPGFPHALSRTYEDLRMARVSVERLCDVPSMADLAAYLTAIEDELAESKLVDRAHVYEIAVREVRERWLWLDRPPVLLLDLPLRETWERELVAAILTHASKVLATVEAGDRAALEIHASLLGCESSSVQEEPSVSSLSHLQQHLFEESAPSPQALDLSVSLASWPGEARECAEIARRIHAEASRGVPFDRMAIFLRSPSLYRAHLEEALRRASVPAWFARGSTRPDPAGRALLALLACAGEGLSLDASRNTSRSRKCRNPVPASTTSGCHRRRATSCRRSSAS